MSEKERVQRAVDQLEEIHPGGSRVAYRHMQFLPSRYVPLPAVPARSLDKFVRRLGPAATSRQASQVHVDNSLLLMPLSPIYYTVCSYRSINIMLPNAVSTTTTLATHSGQ